MRFSSLLALMLHCSACVPDPACVSWRSVDGGVGPLELSLRPVSPGDHRDPDFEVTVVNATADLRYVYTTHFAYRYDDGARRSDRPFDYDFHGGCNTERSAAYRRAERGIVTAAIRAD